MFRRLNYLFIIGLVLLPFQNCAKKNLDFGSKQKASGTGTVADLASNDSDDPVDNSSPDADENGSGSNPGGGGNNPPFPEFVKMKKAVNVMKTNKKVDILFVIDNSGSMSYEQSSMANRVYHFLDLLKGLDWQAGITTTDPRSDEVGGGGALLPMKILKNTFVLKSSMKQSIARSALSETLHREEEGSGSEQGIRAAFMALDRGVRSKKNKL